ncbi:hypothetical protein L2E82_42609 [Cichorium intybus]|uniref:Uncharacterized protein n=1 Tax=Cichorium intybus TaxID=13427 RepID=A0ACB8ZN73_CICIN|nr:hypothetical protein L1887_30287 [Cichorium endivia]KAI3698786.1 hypothetical protein L2E82_42609 [Cichorium intybus]
MGKGLYFIFATMILSGIITVVLHSQHHVRHHKDPPRDLATNASQLLRSNGFNFISTLLHISPDLFLSSPESTIFAIPDSAMSNLSIPPFMTIQLITYHISPFKLTIKDLLDKPLNTCISTTFQQQKISITRKDQKKRVLEINNVLITHPDMFLQGPVVIHGVSGPFASFKFHQHITELPICKANRLDVSHGTLGAKLNLTKNKDEWGTLVKFLNTSGFAPFASGLHSVLDGVFKEHPNLASLTIFAPPIIEAIEMAEPVLQKFVKSHIVPKKHSFKHLASMPQGASIKTLCPGTEIRITETVVNPSEELLSINRVEITSPDLYSSKNFVVHGIARAFSMYEVSTVTV